MQRKKAVELIGYSRMRAKTIGYIIWVIILIVGVLGWILWKWYSLPLAIILGLIFGSLYSIFEAKRVERITGLNIHEQERAYGESMVAKLHPISKNPDKYREYIESLPDN